MGRCDHCGIRDILKMIWYEKRYWWVCAKCVLKIQK
jgi:hypothetical protein